MKLIPSEGKNTASYWCSWRSQRLFMPDPYFHMRRYDPETHNQIQREMLSDEFLFGRRGILSGYMQEIRGDMYVLLDDGWDIPYKGDYTAFGSLELNEDRFPYHGKTPAENLAILSRKVRELGYAGTGLWVPLSCIGERADARFSPAEFEAYWIERAKWLNEADIAYLKVDWGFHGGDLVYRRMLTDICKQYAPRVLVEHTVIDGWFHKPDANGRSFAEVLNISDAFRCYDVRFDFNTATTLGRAAMLLTQTCEVRKDCEGVINVGEEPYVAAALGCTMGIMSHPLLRGSVIRMLPDAFQNGISAQPTLKSEFHSFDHYVRALRWQRLAPAFSFRTGETVCSQNQLEDTWTYTREPYPYDVNDLCGKTVRQSAPATVARATKLPEVRPVQGERGEILPFVAASRNRETGAYTVAALPRTVDGLMNCTTPPAHVICRGLSAEKPFAAFGHFASLTLVFDRPLADARLYGGDLLLSDHGDITDLPGVMRDGNCLVLEGELLDRLGREGASFDDLADPGSVFKLVW